LSFELHGNRGYQPAKARQIVFDDFHAFILMTNDFETDYGKAMDRMTNYAGMVSRLSYLGAMIALVLV
jgi:hypothetical protein